ncbi:MAG: hypothetical protein ACRDRJ_44980 [Streptosporangiaceae bacterium]
MEDAGQGALPPDDRQEVTWVRHERPARPMLAVALGSTSVLAAATLLSMALAFAEKVPCRLGASYSYAKQFQDSCYTDIVPLY